MAERQFVVFTLGEGHFGADIQNINSISEPMKVTELPNADKRIEGIVNLRGEIIPVINLKRLFNCKDLSQPPESRMIVYRSSNGVLGFYADDASQVMSLDTENIDPVPDLFQGPRYEFLSGIGKHNGEIILLLDLSSITESIGETLPKTL